MTSSPSNSSSEPPGGQRTPVDVSILVPSYNSYPYIVSAIESALTQDGVALEVLVQDGGSTDRTLEVLRAFVDSRVRYAVERDEGQSDALNRALDRATGEFVMWLNADDLLAVDAVEELLHVVRASKLDVVHGDFEIVDVDGEVIKRYTSAPLEHARLMRYGTYIFSGAMLIRRELLLEIGGFNKSLHYCMDYDLMLRLAQKHCPAGRLPRVVAQFRRQPTSKSETAWLPFLREWLTIGRRHGASRIDSALTAARFTAYKALARLWRSRAWVRVRPHKHLGGPAGRSPES